MQKKHTQKKLFYFLSEKLPKNQEASTVNPFNDNLSINDSTNDVEKIIPPQIENHLEKSNLSLFFY